MRRVDCVCVYLDEIKSEHPIHLLFLCYRSFFIKLHTYILTILLYCMCAEQRSSNGNQFHNQAMPTDQPNCSACGGQIVEQYLLKVCENLWHEQCLICSLCGTPLAQAPSCYVRDGKVYCKHDYKRYTVLANETTYTKFLMCKLKVVSEEILLYSKLKKVTPDNVFYT